MKDKMNKYKKAYQDRIKSTKPLFRKSIFVNRKALAPTKILPKIKTIISFIA